MNYLAMPNSKTVPNRKTRKQERNRVAVHNRGLRAALRRKVRKERQALNES